ncbi:hypothetical protein H4F17_08285 [Vibrio cholerae]
MLFSSLLSQSLSAQLVRMTLVLVLVLVGVHHSPSLLSTLAEQAMALGCHGQDLEFDDASSQDSRASSHGNSHSHHHH